MRRPRAPLERLAAASLVLRYLLATRQASLQETAAGISPRIQRSLEYIAAHVSDALNVPGLARHIGLSESRFKARFRHEAGLPPGEYIARVKIAAACEALRQPGCKVTELAHALGFSSSQYFATVFRRFSGMTPSEFQATRGAGNP
ncbi:MAG: helix-turn-helix transcriptional regulator [Opitutaceae bacterium]